MTIYKKFISQLSLIILVGTLFLPQLALAQENVPEPFQGTFRARVVNILEESEEEFRDINYLLQQVEAELLQGPHQGETVNFEHTLQRLEIGDPIYLDYYIIANEESYEFNSRNRLTPLLILLGIFVVVILLFGRGQGLRSLIALVASFLAIMYILIPGILYGWNPLLASFIVASIILFAAIFFTHGYNRESLVAYIGTMIAVFISGFFAIIAVRMTQLSGLSGDGTLLLNIQTTGDLNITSLLLGAFIIGFLGVLDDISVTQSAVVTELFQSNKNISRTEVYKRAMRVGREHVGALVNTLVLAYTGAALPLLMFIYISGVSLESSISMEIFATEIVRMIVGSIGLILTVPIVTFLAVRYLKNYTLRHGHSHSHGHAHHHHH